MSAAMELPTRLKSRPDIPREERSEEVTRMPAWSEDPAYWELVQTLMHQGWYRAGRGVHPETGQVAWRFHKGHLVDVRTERAIWVTAEDERAAMRILIGLSRRSTMRPTG